MKRFIRILSIIGYLLSVYILVSVFAAVVCFAGDSFNAFKNSDKMLILPENVEIIGNKNFTRKDILLVTELEREMSFFDADTRKMMFNLTACGWVKKAFVEKSLPNSVRINIEEFTPEIVVTSREKSSDPDTFIQWFSDANGILFKKALAREVPKDMPIFYLKSSTPEEDKKRSEKIKNAIFIAKKWKDLNSVCLLKRINYEFLAGYSLECGLDNKNLNTVVHLKEEASRDEWIKMMEDTSNTISALLAKNQWCLEYDFDKVTDDFGETNFEIIIELVNIKKED